MLKPFAAAKGCSIVLSAGAPLFAVSTSFVLLSSALTSLVGTDSVLLSSSLASLVATDSVLLASASFDWGSSNLTWAIISVILSRFF